MRCRGKFRSIAAASVLGLAIVSWTGIVERGEPAGPPPPATVADASGCSAGPAVDDRPRAVAEEPGGTGS